MTTWAGKQMSLWTYCLPRRMASSRPTSRGTVRRPSLPMAADMTRQKAWDTLGMSTRRSFLSRLLNFTG